MAPTARARRLAPHFLSYVLSFIYLAIYWNNHHHMLHTVERVEAYSVGQLPPVVLAVADSRSPPPGSATITPAPVPTAVYGVALLMPAIAYVLLQNAIVHKQGKHSVLAAAVGKDLKGKISPCFTLPGSRLPS